MSIAIKQFSEILTEVKQTFTTSLGADINFDPSSPTGQFANLLALAFYNLYQTLQLCQNACLIDAAQDQRLDDLIQLINMYRKLGEKTICKSCTLTGVTDYVLPAGSQAKTDTGVIFYSANAVTFVAGSATVDFVSADYGAFTVAPGQLETIVNPSANWLTITNPTASIPGAYYETNAQIRKRHPLMSQNFSNGLQGAIKSALLGITDVKDAYVYVNFSSTTAPEPWESPANSIWIVIDYIDDTIDQLIADTIFTKIPPVITYNAAGKGVQHDKDVDITTQTVNIKWNQAELVPVNVIINLRALAVFTAVEEQNIIAVVSQYIKDNQIISGTLYYSKLYALIVDAAPDAIIEGILIAANAIPTEDDVVDLIPQFYQKFEAGTVTIEYGS